jgi:hypothetical protein
MTASNRQVWISTVILAIPFASMAAEGESSGISWSDTLKITLSPVLIIGFAALIFWFAFRNMKKNPAMKRYEEHMDRVESLLTRIADNLEKKQKDGDKN